MNHGVEAYFVERTRATRRVSGIAAGLGSSLLVLLLGTMLPFLHRPTQELLRRTLRFGYEGPDQYVKRIRLQQFAGTGSILRDVGAIDTRSARRGGAVLARRMSVDHAAPETRPHTIGPGVSNENLMQRTVSRLPNVPVVRSEELVIEHSATPLYPEIERTLGIAGRVQIQALVDTSGRVVDVQVLMSTGVEPFERSAAEAAWQFRFRPYRPGILTNGVYVVMPFWFH